MGDTLLLENKHFKIRTSSKGAEMISLQNSEGLEYIWQGDPTYWGGHAPILFPIVGTIPADMMTESGKSVSMPRHGFARHQIFTVHEAVADRIVYRLTENKETLEQFPFPFQLDVTYSLKENRIRTTFTVTNTGQEDLPFQIGGHPAFRCPLSPGFTFEDASLIFEKEEQIDSPLLDAETGLIDYKRRYRLLNHERELKLKHSLFRKDALMLENPNSNAVTLSMNDGNSITLHFLGFPYLLLWSSINDGPFICLEPWTGLASATNEDGVFEHKRGIIKLASHESRSFTYIITID